MQQCWYHKDTHDFIIQWKQDGVLYTKQNCVSTTFDIQFCTKVCKLEKNERCKKHPEIGDDLCAAEFFCLTDKDGINRCSDLRSEETFIHFDIEQLLT